METHLAVGLAVVEVEATMVEAKEGLLLPAAAAPGIYPQHLQMQPQSLEIPHSLQQQVGLKLGTAGTDTQK